MLFSRLIVSVFLAATLVFAAPVPTNQLSEQSLGLHQANSVLREARIQGKHHSLKLKHSLHQAHPHHEGQRKHVHDNMNPDEHLNPNEEEEELNKRGKMWNKVKNAVKVTSPSRNVLMKPPPGAVKANPVNPSAPRDWSDLHNTNNAPGARSPSRSSSVSSTGASAGH